MGKENRHKGETKEEFKERIRSIGHISKFKPGATKSTPVVNDADGTIGGKQVEHQSGRVDAVIVPKPIGAKSRPREGM